MLSKHKNLIMYFAEFRKRFNCCTHHLICYSRRAERKEEREIHERFIPILMYIHKNNNKKQQRQSLTWVQSVFLIAQMGNTLGGMLRMLIKCKEIMCMF